MKRGARRAACAAFGIAAGLVLAMPLAGAERAVDDLRLALRRDAGWPKDLVLVSFDATRPAELPPLVEKLHTLGAKTIALDLFAPRSAVDALVAAPYAKLRPGEGGTDPAAARLAPCLIPARPPGAPDWAAQAFFAPAEGCRFGHAIAPLDRDGKLRATVPLAPIAGADGSLPSLPLVALLRQRDLPPSAVSVDGRWLVIAGHAPLPLERGELALDLVPGSAPLELPAGEVDGRVAGALVVLSAIGDRVPSALGRETPGGLLFSFAVRTMDLGHVPRRAPGVAVWILVALGAIAASWRGSAAGAAIGGWVVASLLLVRIADLFVPVVGPVIAFLVTAIAVVVVERVYRETPLPPPPPGGRGNRG